MNTFQKIANSTGNNVIAIKQVVETFTVLFDAQTACIELIKKGLAEAEPGEEKILLATLMIDLITQRAKLMQTKIVPEEVIVETFHFQRNKGL